jgi:hypothetical protein
MIFRCAAVAWAGNTDQRSAAGLGLLALMGGVDYVRAMTAMKALRLLLNAAERCARLRPAQGTDRRFAAGLDIKKSLFLPLNPAI